MQNSIKLFGWNRSCDTDLGRTPLSLDVGDGDKNGGLGDFQVGYDRMKTCVSVAPAPDLLKLR